MKTMTKALLISAAALVAVVCIVFCSALLWVKSNHGLQWVQSRINTAIPGEISIDRHRLSLVRPSLALYGVVLHDAQGVALAGFDHLSVQLDGWSLWRREIRMEHALLQAPWADLNADEAAGINLLAALMPTARKKEDEAPTPDGPGLPFNLVFESMQLIDGRFTFTPSDPAVRLEATGLTFSAEGNLSALSGNLDLTAAQIRFIGPGIRPEPASIRLTANIDGDKLRVPAFNISSGHTTVQFSGSADRLFGTPAIDAVLSVDSQLADLKSIFDLPGDYSGALSTNLSLNGTMADPKADLILTLGPGRIKGQPVDQGNLSVKLKGREVKIESATFRLAGGEVNLNGTADLRAAFPKGFFAPPADVNLITYNLNLEQDIPDLNPWLNRFVDLSGRMTSRMSLSGEGVSPAGMTAKLTLDGSGHDLLAPGMDRPLNADVRLAAQMERGKISLSRLDTLSDGLELSGDGHFQIDDQTLAGNMTLTSQDLSHALAVAGITFVEGACNATITAEGNWRRPQLSANVVTKNLKIEAYTLGNISIEADLNHDGQLHLSHLALQNQDSRIHGNGRLRLLPDGGGIDPAFNNTLDLTIENGSAADFLQAPTFDGIIHGRLNLDGPLESLRADLSLNGTAIKADAATIGDVETRIHLKDGTVVVDRFHLQNQDSTVTAAGKVQLLDPGTPLLLDNPVFQFTASSGHLNPEHFVDAASGDFAFNGELAGSLTAPTGKIILTGKQAILAGQPIQAISLDARLEEQRFWLDGFLAGFAPGEQIEGSGWVGMDKTIDLQVKSKGISASRIERLKDLFPGEGVLRFEATAKGALDNPDIDGRLTISEIIVNDEAIEDVDLTVSLHDRQAKAKGNLNFEMDAACDLEKGDYNAHLIFDRTETAAYFRAAGRPGFHGKLSGQIKAAGNIRDAANASAQVDLSALQIKFEELSLVQSDKIALQLADQKLSITDFELAILSEGHLRLKGDARIGGRLDMTVDGRIPLAVAKNFDDALTDATGVVTLEGSISGSMDVPQFDARIDLEKIGMTVPGLVQPIRDLNGRIHLNPESIQIETVKGFLDTGSFAVAGTIGLDHFEPVRIDLKINAGALPLEIRDTLAVIVNGDIQIKGNGRSAEANGEIILLEGLYYKDVNISLLQMASGATTRQRTVAQGTRSMTIPYFDTVNLNISIGHRQPFLAQNNLADFEISPALKIGGTLANPIVSGRAEVRDGTVTFQRKDFDIKKGVVYFVNPYRTEVEIDIDSEAQIRSWKINLAIKGTPDNLEFLLTSQPQEAEADILSLILFGRTAQELTAGEGGATRTTGQIMAEMIADTYGDDIKKSTGVDIFQLETTDGSDGEDAGGIKVTVGKHLSDRMTVKYAIETISGETKQWAIMEYKLLERILVNGAQSTSGLFGAELVYRIEFR